jgi:hypothetical protein
VHGLNQNEKLMSTHTFKIPSIEEVNFEIIAIPDHSSVRGNALISGDAAIDRAAENSILRQIERGNVWAWALVEVKASYKGITSSDYLGQCSYKSEKDFKKGGYFEDMQKEAYTTLIAQLKSL